MTWSSNLNIYRVNRYHPIDLGLGKEAGAGGGGGGWRTTREETRVDLIEQLLFRNMLDVVECIFSYIGIETARDCLFVCRFWYEFLAKHLFKR
jgi:hypothetical protein